MRYTPKSKRVINTAFLQNQVFGGKEFDARIIVIIFMVLGIIESTLVFFESFGVNIYSVVGAGAILFVIYYPLVKIIGFKNILKMLHNPKNDPVSFAIYEDVITAVNRDNALVSFEQYSQHYGCIKVSFEVLNNIKKDDECYIIRTNYGYAQAYPKLFYELDNSLMSFVQPYANNEIAARER